MTEFAHDDKLAKRLRELLEQGILYIKCYNFFPMVVVMRMMMMII